MASTATSRLRLIKQATYDNPETWGVELNNGALDMVDAAFGAASFAVAGNVTLTVENYTSDQARSLFLIMTGAGGFTVTVPAVDKAYLVINNCAADVTVTPLSGTGAVIRAGTAIWWYCDGTDGFVVDPTLDTIKAPAADVAMNDKKLTGLAEPTQAQDASTKNYADTLDTATRDYIDTLVNSTELGTVAAIAADVTTVAGIASAVTAVAAIDDDVTAVAGVSADVTQLADMFVGASATDPTTRLDGSALQAGDYYLNTSGTPTVRVYSGSNWVPVSAMTIASQAQAEAGTNNTTAMTPLRTAQQIAVTSPRGKAEYLADATWAKPTYANWVFVEVIGAGGGGGSGRRGTSTHSGGGGGAGAPVLTGWFDAASLPSSVSITVGSAGAGGASVTTNDTGGNGGGVGGNSSFGTLLESLGGNGGVQGGTGVAGGASGRGWYGLAGTTAKGTAFEGATGATAAANDYSTIYGSAGGGVSSPNSAAGDGMSSVFSGAGGGGGAGDSAGTLQTAGAGGATKRYTKGGGGAAGTSHASAPTAGTAGAELCGGGGGGSATSVAAAAGGAGGLGAGGGGGGASTNGFNSGAGGNGGSGRVRIWWG